MGKPSCRSFLPFFRPAYSHKQNLFRIGSVFPAFKGNYFFGCLRGNAIVRVVLNGRTPVKQEALLPATFGRVREMEEGPDGYIYFSTSNRDGRGSPAKDDDRIMRMVPAN